MSEDDTVQLKKRILKEQAKSLDIPGFRKGKVPLELVRRRLGDRFDELFAEDVGESFVNWYGEKESIPLVFDAMYRLDETQEGSGTLTVEAQIVPPFEVPAYKGLKGTLRKRRIEEADVESFIQEARRSHARFEPKIGPLEEGDVAKVSLRRMAEGGLPLIGEEARELTLMLKPDALPAELFEALVGLEKGQTTRVTVKQDSSTLIQAPSGANHEHYEAMVNETLRLSEPSLETIAALFGIDDPKELPVRIRVLLEEDAEREARRNLREELVTQIARSAEIHLPSAFVESRSEEIRLSLLESAGEDGPDADSKLTDASFFLEQHREQVELNLKELLIVEKIADREGLAATSDQIDAAIAAQANQNNLSSKKMLARLGGDGLRSIHRRITRANVEDFLEDEADVEIG